MILSMDALFGLPRKKAAGQSVRDAIHGDLFFENQISVDGFVSSSAPLKHSKNVNGLLLILLYVYYALFCD